MPAASSRRSRRDIELGSLVGIGRAVGGAVVFALPVLMTMEMWSLGAGMDRTRLAILLVAIVPLLIGLSHYIGFEETDSWVDDLRDAFAAIAIGFATSALVLSLFGLIGPEPSFDEALGAIVIQTVPASFGAVIAQGQLGQSDEVDRRRNREAGYFGTLLFLTSGAVFLSFNIAPTEEIDFIAGSMTPWHAVTLVLVSLAAIHAIVYSVGFEGQSAARPDDYSFWSVFARNSLPGYAIALLVSGAMLWLFGRLDDLGVSAALRLVVVLGFPASIGAAFARLIVGGQS